MELVIAAIVTGFGAILVALIQRNNRTSRTADITSRSEHAYTASLLKESIMEIGKIKAVAENMAENGTKAFQVHIADMSAHGLNDIRVTTNSILDKVNKLGDDDE